jgi:glycosyltransferase involved in cell wall biosynthesis
LTKVPIVSAIVSTYNSEKFIRCKIDDLIGQTIFNDLEIIIINSGSTQKEDSIIGEYLVKYPNIKYIRTEKRETIYKAWNRGIKIATGQFITSSNTDDRLKNDALEILSNTLIKNSDIVMVYADQYLSNIPNQPFADSEKNKLIKFPDYNYIYQLERCIIGSQQMWRSSIHFDEDIWFNEEYEVCGDHEFELIISEKSKIKHLPIPLGTFYKSSNRTNKEFENPNRTKKEVDELTTFFINKYINKCSRTEIIEMQNKYKTNTNIPILLYELIKRIELFLFPGIYPTYFFHSIEFIYFMNIAICEKKGEIKQCIKLCEKFLRYKKSDRIYSKYLHYKSKAIYNEK